MHARDGGDVQLDVSVLRALGAPEGDRRAVGTRGADELDLLSLFAPFDDFQSTGEELERAVLRALETQGDGTAFVADSLRDVRRRRACGSTRPRSSRAD